MVPVIQFCGGPLCFPFEHQATQGPLPGTPGLGCCTHQHFPSDEVGHDAFQLSGDCGFHVIVLLLNGLAGRMVRLVPQRRRRITSGGSYPKFAKKGEIVVVSDVCLLAANSANGSHSDQSS
jgi:hypothetical protein